MTTPAGWQEAALGDVCKIVAGATPKTGVPGYWGGDIRWITPNDLSKDRSQTLGSGERTLSLAGYESCSARLFPEGSVIVSSRAPVGYVAIAGAEMCTNQGCKTAVPPEFIDSRYLYWFLVAAKPDLEARASGTTFKEISGRRFGETRFWWPELDEQVRIVNLLEAHLSRLDAAETSVGDGLRRTATLRRAHLREAFDEGAAELRPLLDVASIANGQTPKGLAEILSSEPGDDAVPFFKVGDMNAADGRWMKDARFFVSRESAERLGLHVRPAGTVLIPKRGGAIATNKKRILKSAAAYDLNTMGLVPNDSLDSSYLWHWLQTVDLGRIADGSNVPQINATQIRELRLPVPDLQTQVAAARRLDEIDESLSRLAVGLESVRLRGGGLRRALLSAAFSGRLTGEGSADLSAAEEMIGA